MVFIDILDDIYMILGVLNSSGFKFFEIYKQIMDNNPV
jgi:hypothetical protein